MFYNYVGPFTPVIIQALYNVSHLPTHTMQGAIMPLGATWGSVFCLRHKGIKPPTLKFVDNLLYHLRAGCLTHLVSLMSCCANTNLKHTVDLV